MVANEKPIPKFSCKLERRNLSLEVEAEFSTITSRQHFSNNQQAIKAAQISAQQMMRKGWRLVMLNGRKVKQGRIVVAKGLALSKIEQANPLHPNTRLPLGDGTAQ